MDTKFLKIANLFIWGGIGILILSIILGMPTFYPYFDTLIQTYRIPLAPPMDSGISAAENTTGILLPFDNKQKPSGYALAAPEMSTPTIAPATVTPVVLPTETVPAATLTPTPTAAPPTPTLTPTPVFTGTIPKQMQIPAIALDAPVISTQWEVQKGADGTPQVVWIVPDWRAIGWHYTSAPLGMPGNTVMNGHNTTRGEVFRDLYKVTAGDEILITGEDGSTYTYSIEETYIVEEAAQSLEVRMENARYIQPTTDERLTLVTCHPYGSTRYRLIVIAHPAIKARPIPELREPLNE